MSTAGRRVIGWDVGGAQVKAAAVVPGSEDVQDERIVARPFEIWRDREALSTVLAEVGREVGMGAARAAAVTMTAELSDTFRTKREGVVFVLDAMRRAFPAAAIFPLSIHGEFVPIETARLRPLDFAATNWVASALFVAQAHPDCLLLDVGGTTTDIIPIAGGRLAAEGLTDTERLVTGELVYTGIVRTNPNTLAEAVPVEGRMCRVAAEYFTIMADTYLVLGRIGADDYTCPTPDGRPVTRAAAAERLARLVCADAELLDEVQIFNIALYLQEKQADRIAGGILQVLSRGELGPDAPVVVAGVGSFLAAEVGRRLGLRILEPAPGWSGGRADMLPAAASACLLARRSSVEES